MDWATLGSLVMEPFQYVFIRRGLLEALMMGGICGETTCVANACGICATHPATCRSKRSPTSNNRAATHQHPTSFIDYLRVLFSRVGHPHCPVCQREVRKLSNEEMVATVERGLLERLF